MRLAELMPITNLIPAAVHEASGDREAALRALNLVEGWSQAFEPDSAFTRVAELLPGADLYAFAVHVQAGFYAQALRSLTKTSWVNVAADTATLTIDCSSLKDLLCVGTEMTGVAVQPRQFSLVVGLKDVLTSFLIIDKEGHRRVLRTGVDLERLGQGPDAMKLTRELLESLVNEKMTRSVTRFNDNMPQRLDWLQEVFNWYIPQWRSQSRLHFAAWPSCPAPLPRVPKEFVEACQESMPWIQFRHGPLPEVRPTRIRPGRQSRNFATAASAVGCFSAVGALGVGAKVSPLLCIAGLVAGASELGRMAVRRTAALLDTSNSTVWANVVSAPQPRWVWRSRQGHTNGVGARDEVAPGAAAVAPAVAACRADGSHACGSAALAQKLQQQQQRQQHQIPATSSEASSSSSSSYSEASSGSAAVPSMTPPGSSPATSDDECDGGSHSREARNSKHREHAQPQGLVLELQEDDAARLGGLLRSYFLQEVWGGGFRARLMQAVEPLLQAFMRWTLDVENHTTEVVVEVDLDEWEIELEGYSFNLHMPSMRFAIVLVLSLDGGVPRMKRAFAAFPDELLDNIMKGWQAQIPEWDLRELDPRFKGFRKPAHVSSRLCLKWPKPGCFRLEAHSVQSRLDLPH